MSSEQVAAADPVSSPDRLVVYTCIYGDGYELATTYPAPSVDYICFTDQDNLEPRGWQVVVTSPSLPADPARSSREQKIRPHRWLPDHNRSLYIDPSVELVTDPTALWNLLLGSASDAVFGALVHSARDSLLEEFAAVLDNQFDAPHVVHEQLEAYTLTDPQSLQLKPVWGGILARRHHDRICVEAMEDWHTHVMRYSRRDQLSLPGVLSRVPADQLHLVAEDNRISEFHRWPRQGYTRPAAYTDSVADVMVPAILRAETEARRRRQLEAQLSAATARRDSAVAERGTALAELAAARRERDSAVAKRDAILTSRIWTSTSWLRRLRTRGRVS